MIDIEQDRINTHKTLEYDFSRREFIKNCIL